MFEGRKGPPLECDIAIADTCIKDGDYISLVTKSVTDNDLEGKPMTGEELRFRLMRLANAYKEMQSIKDNDIFSWEAVKGVAPYIEEYLLHVSVRTYSGPGKVMEHFDVKVTMPFDFHWTVPRAQVVSQPLIFHPHFFHSGLYDSGSFDPFEPFLDFIKRMLLTIAYDPAMINRHCTSNSLALKWFLDNSENTDLFPSDYIDYLKQYLENVVSL